VLGRKPSVIFVCLSVNLVGHQYPIVEHHPWMHRITGLRPNPWRERFENSSVTGYLRSSTQHLRSSTQTYLRNKRRFINVIADCTRFYSNAYGNGFGFFGFDMGMDHNADIHFNPRVTTYQQPLCA
jgi:hypothetical protein